MVNLIRMDLYRMLKSKSFLACLALTFALALASTPLARLLFTLANTFSPELKEAFPTEVNLSAILRDPFPMAGLMLLLLSLCWFFHADVENGYIKNIAGQVPMKGLTVVSKFAAAFVHNAIFVAAGILGNLIGTLVMQRIIPDAQILDSIRVVLLKLLLIQSISAILLMAVATFRSKSLGMVLAVVFGLGLTPVIYFGISEGLKPIFGPEADISRFMPDSVMAEKNLDTFKALAVAAVSGGLFLLPAVRIFDRKDVK